MDLSAPPRSMHTRRILVTNDDGYQAEGINALFDALAPHFEVWMVAPDREQSAQSHALTLHRPLRLTQHATNRFSVDGTPADSVYLAVQHLLKGQVELVISGINMGPNLGDDVAYSGTVSAAMEAAFMGIDAIAISMAGRAPFRFDGAASFALSLAREVLSRGMDHRGLLNVNVPNLPPDQLKGVRATRMGHRRYDYAVEEKRDPRGRAYYWIGGPEAEFQTLEGSDGNAIRDGYISVSPLFTDLTDYEALKGLGWVSRLDAHGREGDPR